MTILALALYNLRQRMLSTVLTAFLVALGVGLVSGIWVLERAAERSFRDSLGKFNLLIGPKGSELQLTLNACFHLDKPVGRMRYAVYEKIAARAAVAAAWPFATGDTFRGFHVVGTTRSFLTDFQYRIGENFRPAQGRVFERDFEAVVGARAARDAGISLGDRLAVTHGFAREGHTHEDQLLTVVGILDNTGTPHDRAIFCSLATVDALHHEDEDHGHDHQHTHVHDHTHGHTQAHVHDHAHSHESGTPRFVTSAMVLLKSQQTVGQFHREINDGPDAMAVMPQTAINTLFDLVDVANQVLEGVSWLVLASAGVSIFLALYNSMAERRREIAIIRALGASPAMVLQTVLLEAVLICSAGAGLGLVLAYGLAVGADPWVRGELGVPLRPDLPGWDEARLLVGAVGIGAVAALLPAVLAYRTDVLAHLKPLS